MTQRCDTYSRAHAQFGMTGSASAADNEHASSVQTGLADIQIILDDIFGDKAHQAKGECQK